MIQWGPCEEFSRNRRADHGPGAVSDYGPIHAEVCMVVRPEWAAGRGVILTWSPQPTQLVPSAPCTEAADQATDSFGADRCPAGMAAMSCSRRATMIAPALSSGSLPLPHFGDWMQAGQPVLQAQPPMA